MMNSYDGCLISVLEHVDGSSKYDNSTVSIVCSVTGPIEPKPRQEIPQQMCLEIGLRPPSGPPTKREKVLEDKLRSVIQAVIESYVHPRQLCQIMFQVLQSIGHNEHMELNAAINSACLGLLNAGIPLKAVFSAVSIAIDSSAKKIVNPSMVELQNAVSIFTIAFKMECGGNSLLLMDSNGSFDEDTVFDVLEVAEKECVELCKKFRKRVEEKITEDFIWK